MSRLNMNEGVVTVPQVKFIPPADWYHAGLFVPHLPGVYEVNSVHISNDESVRRFSYFDGRNWRPAHSTVDGADKNKLLLHYSQEHPIKMFRGLSQEV